MTVREVVEMVKADLGSIRVPAAETHAIGVPIARAIQNLDAVIRAMDEFDQQRQEEAAEGEEDGRDHLAE